MAKLSFLSNADSRYIDSIYESYKNDPESVDFGWQNFFERFVFGSSRGSGCAGSTGTPDHLVRRINVISMINGSCERGPSFTSTTAVGERCQFLPRKELAAFGSDDSDMDTVL